MILTDGIHPISQAEIVENMGTLHSLTARQHQEKGAILDTQINAQEESFWLLKCITLEIQDMDEAERLKALEWVVSLETKGNKNRFWINIVKHLLAKPELGAKALNLVENELNGSNIRHLDLEFLYFNSTTSH